MKKTKKTSRMGLNSKKLTLRKFQDEKDYIFVTAGTTSLNNANITLDYNIYIGKYLVTFIDYIEYCNETRATIPSSRGWGRANRPVINITWYDAVKYCNWKSKKEGLEQAYNTRNWKVKDLPENLEGFRLAYENEWEYAARGGAEAKTTSYAGSNDLDEVGWYLANSYVGSVGRTHPVGLKKPNELGIYDMTGNVWEWLNTSIYGSTRLICGASWKEKANKCKLDLRLNFVPSYRNDDIGFRLIRTVT